MITVASPTIRTNDLRPNHPHSGLSSASESASSSSSASQLSIVSDVQARNGTTAEKLRGIGKCASPVTDREKVKKISWVILK